MTFDEFRLSDEEYAAIAQKHALTDDDQMELAVSAEAGETSEPWVVRCNADEANVLAVARIGEVGTGSARVDVAAVYGNELGYTLVELLPMLEATVNLLGQAEARIAATLDAPDATILNLRQTQAALQDVVVQGVIQRASVLIAPEQARMLAAAILNAADEVENEEFSPTIHRWTVEPGHWINEVEDDENE